MAEKRVNYSSGAPLEEKVGYSRMLQKIHKFKIQKDEENNIITLS